MTRTFTAEQMIDEAFAMGMLALRLREQGEHTQAFKYDRTAAMLRQAAAEGQGNERIRVLEQAVGNCYMMAKRQVARGTSDTDWWQHVVRFCETTGSQSDILRRQLPDEMTEGATPTEPPPPAEAGPKRCGEGPCQHFSNTETGFHGEPIGRCVQSDLQVPADGSGFCHLHSEDKP